MERWKRPIWGIILPGFYGTICSTFQEKYKSSTVSLQNKVFILESFLGFEKWKLMKEKRLHVKCKVNIVDRVLAL